MLLDFLKEKFWSLISPEKKQLPGKLISRIAHSNRVSRVAKIRQLRWATLCRRLLPWLLARQRNSLMPYDPEVRQVVKTTGKGVEYNKSK